MHVIVVVFFFYCGVLFLVRFPSAIEYMFIDLFSYSSYDNETTILIVGIQYRLMMMMMMMSSVVSSTDENKVDE
jgi:hypothetical protein